MLGNHQGGNQEWPTDQGRKTPIFAMAKQCRRSFVPSEAKFWNEARTRFPKAHWRRYAPIGITIHDHVSVWYAPFYCAKAKLIVCIADRAEFPYRIYGQNRALYERHGYTILDFSEDLSFPVDDSVWDELMQIVGDHLLSGYRKAA
jgi:very-short-patch-repair endonuclease